MSKKTSPRKTWRFYHEPQSHDFRSALVWTSLVAAIVHEPPPRPRRLHGLLRTASRLRRRHRFTPRRSHTSPRWQWAACRTVCRRSHKVECQSGWNWKETNVRIRMPKESFVSLLWTLSPGVGFGQVVGAGVDLVDREESWASSTWMKNNQNMKPVWKSI